MKGEPIINDRTSFIDLDRRVEYTSPFRQEQQKQAAVKGMVCHRGEVVVHEGEVVII